LDYFYEYLTSVIPIYLLELFAAIAGLYYLKRRPNTLRSIKVLVYFLWFTVIVEVIGSYAPIAYFTNYEYFGFVKDTVFKQNRWLYNVYSLINYSFLIYFFKSFIQSDKKRKILKVIIAVFLFFGVLNLIFSDIFFNKSSVFISITGTIIVLFSIFIFYFDLLKRDEILDLKRYLPIYISIGALVFNICVTPSDIFSQYFNSNNDLYIKLSGLILLVANIFMYSTFIIGFLVCAKSSKRDKKLTI